MEKYCFGCQNYRLKTEGQKVKRGRSTRWICNFCVARLNISPYLSKKNEQRDTNTGANRGAVDKRNDVGVALSEQK